jgi:hypothetical protein
MERTDERDERSAEFDYYLPGMPTPSTSPGRVERFLKRLFRRRGGLRPVLRRRR